MGAPRQHIRREVMIRVRLPANHDEIAGEVAQQNVVLVEVRLPVAALPYVLVLW